MHNVITEISTRENFYCAREAFGLEGKVKLRNEHSKKEEEELERQRGELCSPWDPSQTIIVQPQDIDIKGSSLLLRKLIPDLICDFKGYVPYAEVCEVTENCIPLANRGTERKEEADDHEDQEAPSRQLTTAELSDAVEQTERTSHVRLDLEESRFDSTGIHVGWRHGRASPQ
ncbi:hypothetical protein M514_08662 [Trichuris suis]|uniref:Uncharacterized protein n=1 Tax=Trichuris suis TaxID=68888 RepID=A0A085MYL9_9BILA|nr:hypothetical protein M513_08662 [Trichuris suis]KFD62315.1 hypothetical protein M514_08662 [Trichuris suis]